MKTTVLHAAILTLLSSPSLYGLGLGDMKVHSYLNQPFHGEIELIDVKGISLDSIKAGLASIEDYEHVGIEQGYAVNLLRFSIGKNKQGKPVIILKSEERITDPYMQLLVDLAWPDGQLYREYNILLDPPGYQLGSSTVYGGRVTHHESAPGRRQAGVVDKRIISHVVHSPDNAGETREQSTYGPVKADETVWQIAQRYKTANVNLQQIVLAIIGMTPNAFEKGNLNGLKVGSKLTIPSTETIQQIPAALAIQEVNAHDEAWKNKSDIQHVLLPPYFEGKKAEFNKLESTSTMPVIANPSEIPAVPQQAVTLETPETGQRKPETRGLMSSVMSATSLFIPEDKTADKPVETTAGEKPVPTPDLKAVKQAADADLKTRAEISVATSAVESVKDANVILNEQLNLLREQNQQLQAHLKKREKDLDELRVKMDLLLKERQSVASQAYAGTDERDEASGHWPLWLLLLLLAGGGGFLFWYLYGRPPQDQGPIILPPSDVSDENTNEEEQPAVVTPSVMEATTETPKPAEEEKAREISEMAAPAKPVKGVNDQQIAMEIEDDIDHSVVEELSTPAPVPVPVPESDSETKEEIEEDIGDKISKEMEETFPDQPGNEKKDQAIKEGELQNLDIIEEKIQPTEVTKETPAEHEEVSYEKEDSLNQSFEKPLEPPQSPSKDYGQDRDYKRPLSSLGELEIDEIEPIKSSFEPVAEIELPEIDINELENYATEPETKEPEPEPKTKEPELDKTKTSDDKDLDYKIDAEPQKKDVGSTQSDKKAEKLEKEPLKEEPEDEFLLDFEPGLYQPEKEAEADTTAEEAAEEASKDSEHSLDFVLEDDEADEGSEQKENSTKASTQPPKDEKEDAAISKGDAEQTDSLDNPLKSKAALDTLLALAKTYIGMDDIEAARQSLQEVAENGDKEQKAEAQLLLDDLDKK